MRGKLQNKMKNLTCARQHRTRLKRWLAVLMAVATLCSTLSVPTLSAVAMESNSGYDLTEYTHSAVVDQDTADSTNLPESGDTTETGSEAADSKTNESGFIGSDTNVSSPPDSGVTPSDSGTSKPDIEVNPGDTEADSEDTEAPDTTLEAAEQTEDTTGEDTENTENDIALASEEEADAGKGVIASGSCGAGNSDNVTWQLTDDGTLTLSGSGETADYKNNTIYKLNPPPGYGNKAKIKKVVIESGITYLGDYLFYDCDYMTEAVLPEGITKIGKSAFEACDSLRKIQLPASLLEIGRGAFSRCPIDRIDIPVGVTTVGSGAFYSPLIIKSVSVPHTVTSAETFPYSETFVLDANVSFRLYGGDADRTNRFIVGEHVTTISYQTMESIVSFAAEELTFQNHWIHLEDMTQSRKLKAPLNSLTEGDYYIDNVGALYSWEEDKSAATLVYCPPQMTDYTVPAAIPADASEGAAQIPLTTVGRYAFSQAEKLETLTFENSSQIETISDFAFANAACLTSINGQTEEAAINALFAENVSLGLLPYQNTQITESSEITPSANGFEETLEENGNTTFNLSVNTSDTAYYDPKTKDGVKQFYTDETVTMQIALSNPGNYSVSEDGGYVARLYIQYDKDGFVPQYDVGTHSFQAHKSTDTSQAGGTYKLTVSKVGENIFCYEFERPINGDTYAVDVTLKYPALTTGGGTCTLWGTITQKDTNKSSLPPREENNYEKLRWFSCPDTYQYDLTASVTTHYGENTSAVLSAGQGKGRVMLSFQTTCTATVNRPSSGNVGKESRKYVDYTTTVQLPEGTELSQEARKALKAGTAIQGSCAYTDDGTVFAEASYSSEISANDGRSSMQLLYIDYDEDTRTVTAQFRQKKYDDRTELGGNAYFNLQVILTNPQQGKYYTATAETKETVYLDFSGTQEIEAAKAEVTFSVGDPILEVEYKTAEDIGGWNSVSASGDIYTFRLFAKNRYALPFTGMGMLRDEIAKNRYLSPENLEAVFGTPQKSGYTPVLTITNATLCRTADEKTVTAYDGQTNGITSTQYTSLDAAGKYSTPISTSDPTQITDSATITMEAVNGQLQISWQYGDESGKKICDINADAIRDALEHLTSELSYIVTYNCIYTIDWWNPKGKGHDVTVQGGEKLLVAEYPATMKQVLLRTWGDYKGTVTGDRTGDYYVGTYSTVTACDKYGNLYYSKNNGRQPIDCDIRLNCTSSASISTGYTYLRGQAGDDDCPQEDSLLEHTTTFRIDGKTDAAVPLIELAKGAQLLLVEAEKNAALKEAYPELQTYDYNGKTYYILEQAGTYTGVWLSGADGKFVYADTVSVSGGTGDRTYDIRVYIPKGSDNTKLSLKYLTLIRTEGAPKSELSGIVWGGDHQARRLTDFYNHVWLNYELKKEIVDTASASAEGKSTSAVEAGQQVIYRISMGTSNEKQGTITLKGSQIRDILPKSLTGTFAWEKGTNVAVSYEIPEDQEYEIQGGDSWSITADTSDANQQILTWGDDFSLTFGDKPVYIYVTLTYPDGEAWEKYSEAYAAAILVNTAETLGMTSSVTHALKITGKAVIQQGVIRSYQAFGDKYRIVCKVNTSGTDSRWVYSTGTRKGYLVDYYVALKNDGKTKLYLTTLQCVLPKGFYYYQDFFCKDGIYYTNYSSYECATEIGTGKTESRINGQIKVSGGGSTSDGRRRVNISFFKGPTDHYDSSCGLYYLNPGETLQFSYTCGVESWENTAETASCTIAMPYYDAAEAGVQLGESRYEYRTNDGTKPNDDQNPAVNTNTWAADNGFYTEDQKEDTSWLSSTVTMYRGKTELGLEKTLASTSNSSDGRPSSATNQETLNWVIKATNSGTTALEDYVLTDVMDAPYEITGGRLKLRNSGFSNGYIIKETYAFMDIPAIRYNKDTGDVTYGTEVLPKDGTAKTFQEYLYSNEESGYIYYDTRQKVDIEVSYVLKDGAPVISFRFKDTLMAITAHGEAELCLSTKKPDGLQNVNQTYVNTAWLTPLKDGIWDETATIGMLDRTLETAFWDEPRTSIRSSANIVVTYGYSTASTLEALQTYDGKSFRASSDAAAVTVLPDKDGTIHYTMTVDNTVYQTPADLTKLVLINNLPEPGDHTTFQESDLRGSEYQIDLAEDPNFQVTVTVVDLVTKEETKKVLESNQYHIEYTKETSFDTADWNGMENQDKWTKDPTGARSFRIVINDATGVTMPEHSKITVEYDAKVDNPDSVKPGQIANNSFGYHYEVKNGSTTIPLEAAPMGVGLRTPYVPTLQKQLENSGGEEMTAAGDTTFRFVIYSGQELTLRNGFTQDDLAEALQNRSFTVAEASVKAGQSASEAAWLSSQVNYISDGNVMTPTTIAWEWKDKTTYHIIEIPARNGYEYASINHSSSADYSFTYNYTNKNTLQCVNIGIGWNMQLTKIREGHEDIKLQDAYFALYSKEQAEQITCADYKALTVAKKPAKTLSYEDTTWYLKSVDKTGADGTLTWTDMTENDYLYVEVQAPNGYALDGTVHKVSRPTDGETSFVTAANRLYYKLPSTGGSGTRPYQTAGLALMAIALGFWLKKRRTRALGFFKRFW